MKDVPSIVLEKAKFLLERGGFVKYLGRSKDGDVYYGAIENCYGAIENCETGFPSVFIFDGHLVKEVEGFEALAISRLFFED